MIRATAFYLVLISSFVSAQSTRQANWQQDVDYNIQVSLDDENHILNGEIEITYTNNSPNTLNTIWMHLWPNAYKNNNTAFAKQQLKNNSTSFYFAKERKRGYIDSLSFTSSNGDSLELEYDSEHIDIAQLKLKNGLAPGATIVFSSPFRVKIPGSFSRMGHVRNSYQISQWYPKPAVYDINGWNTMPYLDQGEFYSEFGSFDVSITLPSNYAVAATGELQDSSEMDWIADRILYYKGNNTRLEDDVASSALLKTLHFKQSNVHDFAWFADKEFYIWESSQMLPDSSKKIKTFVYSRSEYDDKVINYVNEGIEHYSEKVGNYPYSHATAVIGPLKSGGGMEYPMVTILASTDRTTVVHEVGHNWFYGIIGTNERAHPWMDESINTYYENRHSSTKRYSSREKDYLNKYTAQERFSDGLSIVYANAIARNTEQAVNLHSEDYTSSNYGGIIYGKGAYMFSLLQQHLGDSVFDAAMHHFYEQWKYKHPLPGDFQSSIQEFTGDSLNWFFTDLLTTTASYDYKISKIKFKNNSPEELAKGNGNYMVKIKNTGKVAAPLQIMTIAEDGTKVRSRWDSGFTGTKWLSIPGTERLDTLTKESLRNKEAKRVIKRMDKVVQVAINLDNPLNETNIHNNRIRTTGLFKKTEPLAIGGANHLDRRTTPSLAPMINYNYYDNWMFGAVLNNLAHWERRFHYYASGFYSLGQEPFNYEVYARQMFPIRSSWSNRLDIFGSVGSFGHEANAIPHFYNQRSTYNRINVGSALHFINHKKPSSSARRKLTVAYNSMNDKNFDAMNSNSFAIDAIVYSKVLQAKYEYNSNQKLNPLSYSATFEQINIPQTFQFSASSTQKVFAEATKVFHFSKMKNYLQLRGFAGLIFGNNAPTKVLYSSAAQNGNNDYLFERNLLARNEAFSQIPRGVLGARVIDPGFSGFRAPAWLPTNGALFATNIEYSFNKNIPFNLYFDMTYSPNNTVTNKVNYVGGINMRVIKNVFEVSLPFFYSVDVANRMDITNIKASKSQSVNYNPFKHWHRLIVFKLNLNFSQDELIRLGGL